MTLSSSNIALRCTCSATLSVPAETTAGHARCPRCAQQIAITRPAGAASIQSGPCPVCQTSVASGQPALRCGACGVVHHQECWAEVRGCGAYGCRFAPPSAAPSTEAAAPTSAWSDTKKCPVCGETIRGLAVKCRFCQTEFGTVDPLSARDVLAAARSKEQIGGLKVGVSIMFGASIFGIFAPVIVIIALIVAIAGRRRLKAAGPLTTTLAYASLGISGVYAILMLIFFFATG